MHKHESVTRTPSFLLDLIEFEIASFKMDIRFFFSSTYILKNLIELNTKKNEIK